MDQIVKAQTLSQRALQPSSQPLTKSSGERLKSGTEAMRTILKRYPDYGKSPAEYMAAIASILAEYDDAMREALCCIKTGVTAKCKYLPTVADIVEVAEQIDKANSRYRASPAFDAVPPPDRDPPLSADEAARRKAQVLDLLGYDPLQPPERREWAFQTVGVEAMRSSADLKTPNGPVSDELKALLREQGYPIGGNPHE